MKRIPYPNYIRRTGAVFEKKESFLENTTVVRTDDKKFDYCGAVLTQVDAEEKTVATTNEEFHTFVLGETGSGKTRRVILPTIRLLAKSGRSMIISDPKGELYKNTAASLKKNGYEVHILNFRDPSRGERWNPLAYIEKLCKSDDIEARDTAYLMLKDMARILAQAVHSEKDPFWEVEAQKLFVGFSQLIIDNCPEGSLTFENISRVAKGCFADLNQSFPISKPGNKNVRFKDFILSTDRSSIVSSNLFALVTAPNDTRNSITSVFEGMMADYTNQQSLLDLFAVSEFDVSDLGKKPAAIFFVLPDDSDAMYAIATAFVKQTYSILINLADDNRSGVLENKVSFVLDEFANFATIPAVDSMLTAARSRGITFILVCQSMEQLQKKYRDGASEILMSNCRVWIYMSCRNYEFLKRLQSLIGDYVSPFTGESYPLVSISDLQHYKIGEVLVLNDHCYPSVGHLPDYSEYDFGEEVDDVPIPGVHKLLDRKVLDPRELINIAYQKIAPEPDEKTETPAWRKAGEGTPRTENPFRIPRPERVRPEPDDDLSSLLARIDEEIKALEDEEEEKKRRKKDKKTLEDRIETDREENDDE